jgi:hypothetical protein
MPSVTRDALWAADSRPKLRAWKRHPAQGMTHCFLINQARFLG